MPAAKKPSTKPAVKPAAKKASVAYKPVGEATPRYVAPAVEAAPKVANAPALVDESWALSWRFWWAGFWRSIIILVPLNIVLQFMIMGAVGADAEEPSQSLGLLLLLSMVAANVLVQVAVLRYMLRKKHFRGFTFTLTRR